MGQKCLDALSSVLANLPAQGRTEPVDLPVERSAFTETMNQVIDDIEVIAAWAKGALHSAELHAALVRPDSPWPETIMDALDRIRGADTASLAGRRLRQYDIGHLASRIIQGFTSRQATVLRDRILALSPATQAEVASRAGVSRQRISQIQQRARTHLVGKLRSEDAEPVRWRAGKLAMALGSAVPLDSGIAQAEFNQLADQCGATIGSARVPSREFFLYAAGPYMLDDGWLVRRAQVKEIRALEDSLRQRAGPEGLVSVELVNDVLGPHIHAAFQGRWLAERTAFSSREGIGYVDDSGGLLGRASRALWRISRPVTLEELQTEMGTSYNAASARGRLLKSDILKRVGKHKWGLRQWPEDEYTGISDEIAQEIEACGGVATLAHLIDVLPTRYGVAPASVRSLGAAPRFVMERNGEVRLRQDSDPVPRARRALENTPRCYRHKTGWAVRLPVDEDVLRGSGRPCPPAFAEELGLEPGAGRIFRCLGESLRVTWSDRSNSGPSFGSLRRIAARLRCDLYDWVFIQIGEEKLTAWALSGDALTDETEPGRAALLAGGTPADRPRARQFLARSVGLAETASYRTIAGAFRDRGEVDMANLLPTGRDPAGSLDEALAKMREVLIE